MESLNRNIFQRILGICATPRPRRQDCWDYADGKITVELSLTPELEKPGSGLRLESKDCPERVLVVYGDDCRFYAFRNRCEHAGRRLDPIPGDEKIQCCSVGKATYDYDGKIMAGSAKGPIKVYPISLAEGKLTITIE